VKTKLFIVLAAVVSLVWTGCKNTAPCQKPVAYQNVDYGFTFTLPESWRGYTVLMQKWEGSDYIPAHDRAEVMAHGPLIVLRHPQWTSENPRQDILIDVFTRNQWDGLHTGRFEVGVGGYEKEIAHNEKYVFAVSSRFDWGELKGWEETEKIVEHNQAANEPHVYPE
jgi:hypothetical protein